MLQGLPLQVEDITNKLSKNAQLLLERRIPQTVLEYNEERPCGTSLKARLERKAKKLILNLAWRLIYKMPSGYVENMLFNHYGIFKKSLSSRIYNLLETWRYEIFIHSVSRAIYLGISTTESNLDKAYAKLSERLEYLGAETIKGSLSGAMRLELYSEGLEKKYAVLAYIHVNRAFSDMVHELLATPDGRKCLDHYFVISEGGYPAPLEKAT